MATEGQRGRPAVGGPDLEALIKAGGGDGAVGQKAHEGDTIFVSLERGQMPAIRHVPELGGVVEAGRRQFLAVGRERGPVDCVVVTERALTHEAEGRGRHYTAPKMTASV